MAYRMILNETSYFGAGSRKVIAEEVAKRGYKKALIVTDKDLIKFGVADQVPPDGVWQRVKKVRDIVENLT